MSPQPQNDAASIRHPGPPLGMIATIYTVLFLGGLYPVTIFGGLPHFPGPWESAATIVSYFQQRAASAELCAFLHFGAAIALGLFTATVVSQLRFLGVRAAGVFIALFGGLATSLAMIASASVLWTMARPGVAQNPDVVRALYYLSFVLGGAGFSVSMGLLMAGVSIPAGLWKLLPRWVVILGLALAVCGELSWLDLITPKALFLIPFTRFPGFVWLIAVGFLLPKTIARPSVRAASAA